MPSRGSGLATAVASTTLSPMRTTTEPWACLANFPVSNARLLPPVSCTDTSCFMFYFPSGQEGTPVPVWELHNAKCEC